VTSQREIAAARHQSMQLLLALFSAVFVAVVAYGYYHLLTDLGWFIALVGGLVVAAIAWLFARVAGTGDNGAKANWLLVVPLFLISAAGVYNTMMVYLEGSQIMADAAASSQKSFARIEIAAMLHLESSGVARKVNKVNSLRDALFSEIKNPANCGQGPEAGRLIGELQRELPDFKPLSSNGRSCAENEGILEDYKTRLNTLIARAPWNDAELNAIADAAAKNRATLSDLRSEMARSYSANRMHQIRGILEGMQTEYQNLLVRLGRKTNAADFDQELDIKGAQSLGNVYKLPALIISRIGEVSTWVYLIIALGFDILLVYLFQLSSRNRVKSYAIDSAIAGAW